jgi:NitT/TauT family transport system substrate-binding protein
MMRGLGVDEEVPMLGYAFREDWASAHSQTLKSFVDASREAKAVLEASGEEWKRLAPAIGVGDDATLNALQSGYRAGIPQRWRDDERKAATRLYDILRNIGGEKLVGRATTVDPGTFWPAVSY